MKYYLLLVSLLLFSCSNRNEINIDSYNLALQSDTALMKGNVNEAMGFVSMALDIDKSNYIAYNNLGYIKLMLDYPKNEILEAFQKSYKLNNDYLVGLYSLTNCYFTFKDYKNTIKFGNRYLSKIQYDDTILSKKSQILAMIGESYSYRGKFHLAEEFLTKSIQMEPRIATRYKERAIAFRHLGDKTKALNDFNKAIILDSLYHQAYNSRAIYFDNNKMYEKALLDYNKAIELEPNSAIYLLNRAKLLIDLDNIEQACIDIIKADSLGSKEGSEYRLKYCNGI